MGEFGRVAEDGGKPGRANSARSSAPENHARLTFPCHSAAIPLASYLHHPRYCPRLP